MGEQQLELDLSALSNPSAGLVLNTYNDTDESPKISSRYTKAKKFSSGDFVDEESIFHEQLEFDF